MRLRRRRLLQSCALAVSEKTCCRLRDSRCDVPVTGMLLILFVSSQHIGNTYFCTGDACHATETHTDLLYRRVVPLHRVTRQTKYKHARALIHRRPPAEPCLARAGRARQRAAPCGCQRAREARSRLPACCALAHTCRLKVTCQSHLSKSPVKVHLS